MSRVAWSQTNRPPARESARTRLRPFPAPLHAPGAKLQPVAPPARNQFGFGHSPRVRAESCCRQACFRKLFHHFTGSAPASYWLSMSMTTSSSTFNGSCPRSAHIFFAPPLACGHLPEARARAKSCLMRPAGTQRLNKPAPTQAYWS